MPIQVTCHCGRQLRLKDDLAGRQVRCPSCQDPLLVPGKKAAQRRKDDANEVGEIDEPYVPTRRTSAKKRKAGQNDLTRFLKGVRKNLPKVVAATGILAAILVLVFVAPLVIETIRGMNATQPNTDQGLRAANSANNTDQTPQPSAPGTPIAVSEVVPLPPPTSNPTGGDRLLDAYIQKVNVGMSRDEVIAIVGSPTTTTPLEDGGAALVWLIGPTRRKPKDAFLVRFNAAGRATHTAGKKS